MGLQAIRTPSWLSLKRYQANFDRLGQNKFPKKKEKRQLWHYAVWWTNQGSSGQLRVCIDTTLASARRVCGGSEEVHRLHCRDLVPNRSTTTHTSTNHEGSQLMRGEMVTQVTSRCTVPSWFKQLTRQLGVNGGHSELSLAFPHRSWTSKKMNTDLLKKKTKQLRCKSTVRTCDCKAIYQSLQNPFREVKCL